MKQDPVFHSYHSGSVSASVVNELISPSSHVHQKPRKQNFNALPEVLRQIEIEETVAEAKEEGYPEPSDKAIQNAKRLLRKMYQIARVRFVVYPTVDGEIALDVPSDRGSVILLCDSLGGALCLVNIDGSQRCVRYSSTTSLPDGFVRQALSDLLR